MIEQQVLHAEFGGELAGVERRAVRLLVGLELLAVGVEAESLAEQPVGVFYHETVLLVVRFVAETSDSSSGQFGTETILLLLRGVDVEALHTDVAHLELVAIVQFVEDHTLCHLRQLFLGENHVDDGAYHELHLVVAIHMEPTLIALALRHHAYQPYHAEDVVGVGVGYEEMMNVGDSDVCLFQLCEHAVAASAVNKQ